MTTGAPPPKEGEKKATYAPTPINKPAAAPAKPAPKKDFSLNEVPTPILLVGVVFIAFIVQYVYGKVMHLQDLEKNWNPAPKNLKDNEVVILYCTS